MLRRWSKRLRKRVRALVSRGQPTDAAIGVIDAVDGYVLRGWFISSKQQDAGHRFTVYVDDHCLGTFSADQPRPDVKRVHGVGDCGFALDLETALHGLPGGSFTRDHTRPHRFELRTPKGRVVAERLEAGPTMVRGVLDRLDARGLAGWAVDVKRPGAPIELTVVLDGLPLVDLTTTDERSDLAAMGLVGTRAGFSLSWPRGMLREGSRVELRSKETGEPLSSGPRSVAPEDSVAPRPHLAYLDAHRSGQVNEVTVVVTVFNAHDAVAECLESLEQETGADAELLVIDDCSTDERIAELLASYAERPRFRVVKNAEQLGYTRSINRGVELAGRRDVVLLNSDTVVTHRWLESLRYAAYSETRVATVTPLSDNAGAFSSPEIDEPNPLPAHHTPQSFARAIVTTADGRFPHVPTGNGFCMYIRRAALDALGHFDEQKFPRGYGEENDFCMRGLRRGWKHLICDKAYVLHKRSMSFRDEKAALAAAGARQLHADYPEYSLLTRRFWEVELCYVRYRARVALRAAETTAQLPRILFVVSTRTGGMPQINLDLMRSLEGRYHGFLLRSDRHNISLSELDGDQLEPRETYELAEPLEPVTHRSDEYDRVVLDMLYRHSIALLHIRHLAWHGLGLAAAARSLGIPVVYSCHDFYAACPSHNLLDDRPQYCAGECTPGDDACLVALWPREQLPPLKNQFVHRWRAMFREVFAHCDRVVLASPSSAAVLGSLFPEIKDKARIIAHGRDLTLEEASPRAPKPGATIRVLVPGNIGVAKGAALLEAMASIDGGARLELHFLGHVAGLLSEVGVRHGRYERSRFHEHVEAIAPAIGVVLSICPETYCHTLTELWACGIPVLGIDLGSVGDRIRTTGAGWLVAAQASAAEVRQAIIAAVEDETGYAERVAAVHRWQRTEGTWNDRATMSVEYRRIYAELLEPDRGTPAPPARMGLIVRGRAGSAPPTAYIRVLRPLRAAETGQGWDARVVSLPWLQAGGLDHIDGLVVQRNAVPPAAVDTLIAALHSRAIPYVYEIDDRLWDMPGDLTDHDIDADQREAIEKLVRHAHTVTTSTEPLAAALRRWNERVQVVVNELDESLWAAPFAPDAAAEIVRTYDLGADVPRILYMGTRNHALDLQMIAPALSRVLGERPDVELLQVRGGALLPGARKLPIPSACGQYPAFVRWFRVVCSRCTLAVAPLRATDFNAAKSDIKTLDYGLGRVPGIYSAVPPYEGAIEHGETGLLCANDTDAWTEAIIELLDDGELQARIRAQAEQRALARTFARSGTPGWRRVLADLVAARRSGRSDGL